MTGSVEPVFGLSLLGYCKNMTVQHGELLGRGAARSVYIKSLIFRRLYTYENIVMNISSNFCRILQIVLSELYTLDL